MNRKEKRALLKPWRERKARVQKARNIAAFAIELRERVEKALAERREAERREAAKAEQEAAQ